MADPLELEDAVTFLEEASRIFPDVTSILNTNQLLVLDADPKVLGMVVGSSASLPPPQRLIFPIFRVLLCATIKYLYSKEGRFT